MRGNKTYLKQLNKAFLSIFMAFIIVAMSALTGCSQVKLNDNTVEADSEESKEISGDSEEVFEVERIDSDYRIYLGHPEYNEIKEVEYSFETFDSEPHLVYGPGTEYKITNEDLAVIERDFYYNLLNENEKEDFKYIYSKLKEDPYGEIKFDHVDADKAINAFSCSALFHRYGELFSMGGYYKENIQKITVVKPTKIDGVNLDSYNSHLNNAVSSALAYPDFYSRVAAVHNYCVNNFYYDWDNQKRLENHVSGGISDGSSVCEGFAKFCNAAFSMIGVRSIVVCSYNHAWNLVYSEKEQIWYIFDVTWDLGTTGCRWMLVGTDSMSSMDMNESHTKNYGYNLLGGNPVTSKSDFDVNTDNYLIADYAYVVSDETKKIEEEQKRLEEEKAAEEAEREKKKEAEEKATEEQRKLEEQKRTEEEKRIEEKRIADEQQRLEEEAKKKEAEEKAIEEQRKIEEQKKQEEAKIAEEQKKQEEAKIAEEQKRQEEAKAAEEQKKPEEEKENNNILVDIEASCYGTYYLGDSIEKSNVKVFLVKKDGSKEATNDFTLSKNSITDDGWGNCCVTVVSNGMETDIYIPFIMPKVTLNVSGNSISVNAEPSNITYNLYSANPHTVDVSGNSLIAKSAGPATICCDWSYKGYSSTETIYLDAEEQATGDWQYAENAPAGDYEVEYLTFYKYYFFTETDGSMVPMWSTENVRLTYTEVFVTTPFTDGWYSPYCGYCFNTIYVDGPALVSNDNYGWRVPVNFTGTVYEHESSETITGCRYRSKSYSIKVR